MTMQPLTYYIDTPYTRQLCDSYGDQLQSLRVEQIVALAQTSIKTWQSNIGLSDAQRSMLLHTANAILTCATNR